ncbi:TonB-dependent receptor [Aurantiacibacter suaedae]|uniref:TonB-dependent receptor n=1 Tax=Aurantiacibacter suaedae TaxID=2545755 RepID=UPI0010F6658E|nr:TonB-dependent receptor [Aurantiacibacter suaedae]
MTRTSNIRKPASLRRAGSALALGAAVAGSPAMAQDANGEVVLDTLRIEDRAADVNPYSTPGAPYKAERSGDIRITRPIADTPTTMTVLTENQIDDSGYTDLSRILEAQPGITVGTGENGNAFGDRYIIRGQEARSDVFVDGLRDPGMTTRESFVVEQIEITKGPNSTFAGRGTAGGAVNLITKAATTDYDFFDGTIGVGTDRFVRLTGDVNLALDETFAIRANGLNGYTDIPDREPGNRRRSGGALSATWSPSYDFDLTLDYYLLRAKDRPDLGDYLSGDVADNSREPVETPAYMQEQDFQKSNVDVVTGRLNWQLTDNISFSNRARYGESHNGYVVTGARGTTTDASDPNGAYDTFSLSTHQGWQDVEYFANQANLLIETEALGGENDLIFGAEYTDHKVLNGVYDVNNTGATNCITPGNRFNPTPAPNFCGLGPNGQVVSGLNNLLGREITKDRWDSDWQVETFSIYLMDTIDLTESLTVFGGLRWDTFDFTLSTLSVPRGSPAGTEPTLETYAYDDSFWNGHFGVTYRLNDWAMVYGSFATAADINGGESDLGTNSGYGGLVIIDGEFRGGSPERSENWELGTKLELFDHKFLLTGALFQTTKSDVLEGSAGGYTPDGTGNTGKNRTRGFELGVAGNITPAWSMQGGLTYVDTDVLESAVDADYIGKELANTAKWQASFQTRYQATDAFAIGGAVKYKGERYGGQPDTAAGFTELPGGGFAYSQPVPAYTVADLFAEYRFSNNMSLRVNVNNVFDENYYLAVYRSGGFLYKGDARQAVATLNLRY